MSYTTIRTLLDQALADVSGIPDIQEENKPYDTSGKALTPWARTTLSPAEVSRLSNEADLLNGLFIIDLFYPLNKGTTAAATMVDTVLAAFPRGEVLSESNTNVHIIKSWPGIAQGLEKYYQVQLFVQWESEKAKG